MGITSPRLISLHRPLSCKCGRTIKRCLCVAFGLDCGDTIGSNCSRRFYATRHCTNAISLFRMAKCKCLQSWAGDRVLTDLVEPRQVWVFLGIGHSVQLICGVSPSMSSNSIGNTLELMRDVIRQRPHWRTTVKAQWAGMTVDQDGLAVRVNSFRNGSLAIAENVHLQCRISWHIRYVDNCPNISLAGLWGGFLALAWKRAQWYEEGKTFNECVYITFFIY